MVPTKDEKAAFIVAVHESMEKLLGPLHEESYVHMREVRDDAYGYGGVTQGRRYIERQCSTPIASAA